MTPEEKQRIYEEEKARADARRKIEFDRQYGGCLGRIVLGAHITQLILRLGCLTVFLALSLWFLWGIIHR